MRQTNTSDYQTREQTIRIAGNNTRLERSAGVLVVPPVLFLMLPAAVRHLLTGTAPVGRGTRTHSTHVLRHCPGKPKNSGV
jgi:hypothetical protein